MIRPLESPCLLIMTQTAPVSLSVSQYLLLSIGVIAVFGVEVFATGLVAKKLRIFDANYGKALWAAVLKNGILGIVAYLLSRYTPDAPRLPVLFLVGTVAPITIYKLVFESTIAQATLIWIFVLLIESVAGTALVYAALSIGAILDERFNLVIRSGNPMLAPAILSVLPDSTNHCCWSITAEPLHGRESPDAN